MHVVVVVVVVVSSEKGRAPNQLTRRAAPLPMNVQAAGVEDAMDVAHTVMDTFDRQGEFGGQGACACLSWWSARVLAWCLG